MGACASVPKAMRGEETAVSPEQLKEEMSVPTEAAEAEEAMAEEEKVVVENDKNQSIGKLLVEEIPKESEGSSQATTVPEIEESKPDPPSISEPVAPVASRIRREIHQGNCFKEETLIYFN
ncbi:uncharacterized protein LOC142527005 [Primulina tabacum]|uniref:uncharacterized protein LOC142527005 n=1 Tax=Primulina tabacum TaxID=48773 RepID=UPI003F5A8576